jgi:hypothetical protein
MIESNSIGSAFFNPNISLVLMTRTDKSSFRITICFKMWNVYVLFSVAGNRNNSDGSLNNVGSNGNYWSSTVNGTNSSNLNFNSGNANMNSNNRANGFSVRCMKDYGIEYKRLCLFPIFNFLMKQQ